MEKYEEALERAKQGLLIDKISPELRENEDEKIRKALLRCCDDWDKGQFGCMAKEDVPAIRVYLEKQKNQKPAEWSKEDDSKIDSIISIICTARECSRIANIGGNDNSAFYNGLVVFLKSICSQLMWKPSKEQMDRLSSIIASLRKDYCDDMADFLASLYHDLQKLL